MYIQINENRLINWKVPTIYSLKYQQFCKWISQHPKLFQYYFNIFHNQIWEEEPSCQIKPFQLIGTAFKLVKKQFQKRQLKLFLTSLIVYSQKNQIPQAIICLEGLSISQIMNDRKFGIQISHRDGIYQTKQYFFQKKQDQIKWIKALGDFKTEQINSKYSIMQKLATGKFSVVYKGLQKQTKKQYAIKVIQKFRLTAEEKAIISYYFITSHQTQIMKILNYSYIIKFKEVFETKTHLYIITQLIYGGDLFQYIYKNNNLQQSLAALIIGQLIQTIIYIHSLDIIHRDLKPQNILLKIKNQKVQSIKVIDFGFANYVSNIQKMSKDELLIGTPNYVAPEVLLMQKISFKVDNFAIGSILYFILTGNLPFDSIFAEQILKNTINGKFDFAIPEIQLSDQVKDLIQKLLQLNPQKRISLKDCMQHPWIIANYKSKGKKSQFK